MFATVVTNCDNICTSLLHFSTFTQLLPDTVLLFVQIKNEDVTSAQQYLTEH